MNNNKVGGIIFVIIGVVVGFIFLLIVYEFGFMSWWLYIIVLFVLFYLYKYVKGLLYRFVLVIIGVIIVVVSLSMFLYIWVNLVFYNDMILGVLLSDKEVLFFFLLDLVFLFIGILVGIIFSVKFIYNNIIVSKLKDLEDNL